MKRIILTLLAIIVVFGLFAATGYAGYRVGFTQGAQSNANGDAPQLRPFDEIHPRGMPGFGFERGFQRGFGPGRFPMGGFGFFSPLMWLGRIAFLALIVWFIYWLLTRSGWRLTRQTMESVPPPAHSEPASPSENE